MRPLFLTDLLQGMGFGQQVVLAAVVGLVVWYLFRAMKIGKKTGSAVGTGLQYVMAVGVFVAIGIYFGWVEPVSMFSDLVAGGRTAGEMGWSLLVRYVPWL